MYGMSWAVGAMFVKFSTCSLLRRICSTLVRTLPPIQQPVTINTPRPAHYMHVTQSDVLLGPKTVPSSPEIYPGYVIVLSGSTRPSEEVTVTTPLTDITTTEPAQQSTSTTTTTDLASTSLIGEFVPSDNNVGGVNRSTKTIEEGIATPGIFANIKTFLMVYKATSPPKLFH